MLQGYVGGHVEGYGGGHVAVGGSESVEEVESKKRGKKKIASMMSGECEIFF